MTDCYGKGAATCGRKLCVDYITIDAISCDFTFALAIAYANNNKKGAKKQTSKKSILQGFASIFILWISLRWKSLKLGNAIKLITKIAWKLELNKWTLKCIEENKQYKYYELHNEISANEGLPADRWEDARFTIVTGS